MQIPITVEDVNRESHGGASRVIAIIKAAAQKFTPPRKFIVENHPFGGWVLVKKQETGEYLVKSRTHPSHIGYGTLNGKAISTFAQEIKNGTHTTQTHQTDL